MRGGGGPRVCPSERFLDPSPLPIDFVHDEISKLVFYYYYNIAAKVIS